MGGWVGIYKNGGEKSIKNHHHRHRTYQSKSSCAERGVRGPRRRATADSTTEAATMDQQPPVAIDCHVWYSV